MPFYTIEYKSDRNGWSSNLETQTPNFVKGLNPQQRPIDGSNFKRNPLVVNRRTDRSESAKQIDLS